MAEKSLKPEIRFAGFTGAWERRELGEDVADIVGGGTPSTSNSAYWNGNIDWYSPTEIGEKVYADGSEKQITELGLQKSSAKVLPANRTVLFTSRAGIGDMAILRRSGTTNQGFQSLIIKDGYDTYFVYSMGYLIKNYALKNASGSTFLEISNKVLGKMNIQVPSLDEQTKIGNFFARLDDLITLHQRELEKLKNIKKAMLDKMFPKEGADVPEIRFAGFTGAWEQRKLGEVGCTYTGLYGKVKEDFGHGDGKFITYMNVFSNPIAQKHLTEPIEVDLNQNEVQAGDVFFTTSSETPEEVGMSSVLLENSKNTYLNSFCFGYRPTEKFESYYLAYMLRSTYMRKKIVFLAQGISRYNISKNKVMDIYIPIPKVEEQKRIGDFFKHLDNLITLHQRELERLKNIKKSLLDKMFV